MTPVASDHFPRGRNVANEVSMQNRRTRNMTVGLCLCALAIAACHAQPYSAPAPTTQSNTFLAPGQAIRMAPPNGPMARPYRLWLKAQGKSPAVTPASGSLNNLPRTILDLAAEVSTFAGGNPIQTNGNALPGEVDGPLSTAQFYGPWGIARDGAGNIYVADNFGNTIRKITSDGTVSTLAGHTYHDASGAVPWYDEGEHGYYSDGTGTAAGFNAPFQIALDSAGNVFVADGYNSVIRKVTPAGVVTTIAGVYQPNPDPTQLPIGGYSDGPALSAQFKWPEGIAVAPNGDVYVADSGNAMIRKISSSGQVTTVAGNGNHTIADGQGASAAFAWPIGLAFDGTGNLIIADYGGAIRKMTPDGTVTTIAGPTNVAWSQGYADGPGSSALFNYPAGVAISPCGNIYVADEDNALIRQIAPDGTVSTVAGFMTNGQPNYGYADGPAAGAMFNIPENLVLDGKGNLFETDLGTDRIREISPLPVTTCGSSFSVLIDGQTAYDGNSQLDPVVDDLFPAIQVKVQGSLDSYDTSSLKIVFSKRPDGVTPQEDRNSIQVDSSNNTIRYRIPFRHETALDGGDQTITVLIKDKQGQVLSKTINFAVGGHTLYAGVPPITTAYKVLSLQGAPDPAPYVPDAIKALEASGVQTLEFNARTWSTGFIESAETAPPRNAYLYAALVAGQLVLYYYDGTYTSYWNWLTRGYDEVKVNKKGIKTLRIPAFVQTDPETLDNYAQDISLATEHEAAVALKQATNEKDSNVELWQQLKTSSNRLLVYRGDAITEGVRGVPQWLYHLRIGQIAGGTYTIASASVPGFWKRSAYPATADFNFDSRQWADTAREVMQSIPDYDNPHDRKRFGWNFFARYPVHQWGNILDPQNKPYQPGNTIQYYDTAVGTRVDDGAAYAPGVLYPVQLPRFNDPAKYLQAYKSHYAEFTSPKFDAISADTAVGMPRYLTYAQNFYLGFLSRQGTPDWLRGIKCYVDYGNARENFYDGETNQIASIDQKGNFITFYRPDARAGEIKRLNKTGQYDFQEIPSWMLH